MGNRAWWIVYRTWDTTGVEVVREASGTQSSMTYIGIKQATVAQWVDLRPKLEVFAGEKGYKGGGCRREAC